ATFTSRRIESRNTLGQNGPSIRPAVAQNNTVYVAYFGWRSNAGDTITSDIVVARDDNGATSTTPFRDLRDPSDNQPGRLDTTNPSLAVADDGTVGLLYQQLTGTGSASRWVNRFEQSRDGFATHKDLVLATVPANTPALQFLPYLGDYNMLLTRGNEFLGIFSAGNTPDPANFPSGVVFQRRVSQATHQLLDASGSPVDVSIDPRS